MENAVTQVSAFSCLMGPRFGPSFESVLYSRGRFQMVYNGRAAGQPLQFCAAALFVRGLNAPGGMQRISNYG